MTARASQDYAWILLLIAGCMFIFVGAVHLVSGRPVAAGLGFVRGNLDMSWTELVAGRPELANAISGFIRMMAVSILGLSVLFVSMVATSYRSGERWAWYAAWVYPAAVLGYVSVAALHHGWASDEWVWVAPGMGFVLVLIGLGLFLSVSEVLSQAGADMSDPCVRGAPAVPPPSDKSAQEDIYGCKTNLGNSFDRGLRWHTAVYYVLPTRPV